eukprot:752110-Hanusia_phi.AAC.10
MMCYLALLSFASSSLRQQHGQSSAFWPGQHSLPVRSFGKWFAAAAVTGSNTQQRGTAQVRSSLASLKVPVDM